MNRGTTALGEATGLALKVLLVLAGCGGVVFLASGIRRIDPGAWVVVTRFGAVVRDQGPGLLVAWPRPIEDSVVVPGPSQQLMLTVSRLDRVEQGESAAAKGSPASTGVMADSYVLTGDVGMAHVGATVIYSIQDARRWFVQRDHVESALKRLLCQAVVQACASRALDGVLVASVDAGGDLITATAAAGSRENLRQEVADALDQGARALGLGIAVSRVDLQVTLPAAARTAFANVVAAEATAATQIATARTDAERAMQEARANADRIQAEASAVARELVTRAHVATNAVRGCLMEHLPERRALLITRVWRERLETIVRKAGSTTAIAPGSPAMALPGRSQ
ncbi:MAG: hypothetical protein H0W78_12675 [Planctomycetes bacterium]|nr:hypothetical protein [Planctomycetota bacterium]